MVDPTSGIGQIQNISGTNKTQNSDNKKSEDARSSDSRAPSDEVQISEEALSLVQAEEAAEQVKETLRDNPGETLGLDPNFDQEI